MRSFKIAVCFSSQPRLWKFCVENIKRFFIFDVPHIPSGRPIQTDFFMHIWDTNSWREPKTDRNTYINEKHNDFQEIKSAYNPIRAELEVFEEQNFKMAWDPMFHSFAKSLLLKRQYELELDFEYDIVIKARLDTLYNLNHKFPIHSIVQPKQCYTSYPIMHFPTEFNYWNFDDVLFYGHSNTMDLVGDIYRTHIVKYKSRLRNLKRNLNLDPAENWFGPGAMLYDHMISLGIHPTNHPPGIQYVVSRKTMIDKNLDPLNLSDFDKIITLGRNWYI